ncbi:MAG TPA: hypothetical protein VMT03_04435 [Polyangia bacterium]|nr:hypothetical protein [Polyangia bacterium]
MGAAHVLNSTHPVIGCDSHSQAPPPQPPLGPHIVVGGMGQADPTTSKASATVKAGAGYALGRQHDLGRGKYHFAANMLLPLVWAGAGNKAEFGCSSVRVGGCGKDNEALSMAAALGWGLNLQLDCGEPCPAPTSICIASFNTVFAGLTAADKVAGFQAMTVDLVLTWAVGKIAGVLASALHGRAYEILGDVLSLLGPDARFVGALLDAAAAPTVRELMKTAIGWFIGTPLGYSYSGPVPPGGEWDPLGSHLPAS